MGNPILGESMKGIFFSFWWSLKQIHEWMDFWKSSTKLGQPSGIPRRSTSNSFVINPICEAWCWYIKTYMTALAQNHPVM
jgi:hypothetical protein